jgi:hypothetical protein
MNTNSYDSYNTNSNTNDQSDETNSNSEFDDDESYSNEKRKKRKRQIVSGNQTNDMISFCGRYAQLEKSKDCVVRKIFLSYNN